MGGNFVKNDFASSEKGSTLKGKEGKQILFYLDMTDFQKHLVLQYSKQK